MQTGDSFSFLTLINGQQREQNDPLSYCCYYFIFVTMDIFAFWSLSVLSHLKLSAASTPTPPHLHVIMWHFLLSLCEYDYPSFSINLPMLLIELILKLNF